MLGDKAVLGLTGLRNHESGIGLKQVEYGELLRTDAPRDKQVYRKAGSGPLALSRSANVAALNGMCGIDLSIPGVRCVLGCVIVAPLALARLIPSATKAASNRELGCHIVQV
jgi:hypothetical protein